MKRTLRIPFNVKILFSPNKSRKWRCFTVRVGIAKKNENRSAKTQTIDHKRNNLLSLRTCWHAQIQERG